MLSNEKLERARAELVRRYRANPGSFSAQEIRHRKASLLNL
jgi:hypothetical protein